MREDLTGRKFNRLTVKEFFETRKNRKSYWVCVCDCGNEVIGRSDQLKDGNTKSCGCYKRETDAINASKNHTHKGSRTRLYHIWQNMKSRCYNKNDNYYNIYGEKGVTICDEWKNDFSKFREWSEENGYNDELTIDRRDVSGGYNPNNCRWANQKEQANNRTSNLLIKHNGIERSLKQWSEELGIKYSTIHSRYYRGYRGEELFKPVKKR